MKKYFLIALLIASGSLTTEAQISKFDLNDDGKLTVADITVLVNAIMSGVGETPSNVVAVDLGLPSGTLWANMNVGATSSSDDGLYFAYGETTGYTSNTSDGHVFNWANYKYCNGTNNSIWKYCTTSISGAVDDKTTLEPKDDAAYVNWGDGWRIPTKVEMQELIDNTQKYFYSKNGVRILQLTSKKNGKMIELPFSGNRYNSTISNQGTAARYWTSTVRLTSDGNTEAYTLWASYPQNKVYDVESSGGVRCYGYPIRAVRSKQ